MRIAAVLATLVVFAVLSVALASPAGAGRPTFNPVCLGTKIEGGESGTYAMTYGDVGGTISILVEESELGPVFSFDTGNPQHLVGQVDVKGGTALETWMFGDGVTTADGLHAALNATNGTYFGISYVCFHTAYVDDGGEEVGSE